MTFSLDAKTWKCWLVLAVIMTQSAFNAYWSRLTWLNRLTVFVKEYSTGMKQRLGLAAALLNDPDLVMLDEPTNGLDPTGIQEMRTFIRDLADKQGKTVFLSSHMLGEVEQVCDRVAIINQGRIIREGKVVDLLAAPSQLMVEVEPVERATAVLSPHFDITPNGKRITICADRRQNTTGGADAGSK